VVILVLEKHDSSCGKVLGCSVGRVVKWGGGLVLARGRELGRESVWVRGGVERM